MNIIGIGVDTVDIKRFRQAARTRGERFLKRIFTEEELRYAKKKKDGFAHMAGKFAAKEAVKKALPDGFEVGLSWPDIEIYNEKDGKPRARLHGYAAGLVRKFGIKDVFVSISHDRSVAVSNAVVTGDGS